MVTSLLIKFAARIIQGIGLIYRPKKCIRSVKTILVNKADRIGDAIVALPFLLELKKHFSVTILTTAYNDFVFKDYFKTEIAIEKPRYIFDEVKAIVKSTLLVFQKRNARNPEFDVYLDLNGIREVDFLIKLRQENRCKYYVGLNYGPFNIFLDYAHSTNSMLFAKKHILETFKEVTRESLGVDIDVPDYIDLSSKMQEPKDILLQQPFILINIAGASNFRGPAVNVYTEIVKSISAIDNRFNFVVIDELNQSNIGNFKNLLGDVPKNIFCVDHNLELWELLYIASKSMLYIGADSGVSHLLDIPTNAMILFGGGPVWSWLPYSKNLYRKKQIGELVVEETRTSKGFIKKVIHKPILCRPCFDIGCRTRECIKVFDRYKEDICAEIKDIITRYAI